MKVVQKHTDNRKAGTKDRPPIPLERPERVELETNEYISLKLRTDPADAESQTYGMRVKYFSTGTPEEFILFRRDVNRVLVGQHATTGPLKYNMTRRLLDGEALATFEEAALDTGAETNANFELCMNHVATHVFPQRALRKQKHFMRGKMRKDISMNVRTYVARINEINASLDQFPPFAANQQLPNDEIMDLLNGGIPKSWSTQMILQGFDPIEHTTNEFVEFCERLETTEADAPAKSEKSGKASKKDSGKRKRGTDSTGKGDFYCELHGKNPNHNTGECRTLIAQAKKMKAAYAAQAPGQKRQFKKKQELHAIISESVDRALKKKKRKRAEPKDDASVDLENFNFSDLDMSDDSGSE